MIVIGIARVATRAVAGPAHCRHAFRSWASKRASKSSRPPATKSQDVPLAQVGGKGLVHQRNRGSAAGRRIDLAVHSLKDMPRTCPRPDSRGDSGARRSARCADRRSAEGSARSKWAPVRCGARRNCMRWIAELRSKLCAATSTRGFANSTKGNTTRLFSRRRDCGASAGRTGFAELIPVDVMCPAVGPGRARDRDARRSGRSACDRA